MIWPQLKATTKKGIIKELADNISASLGLADKEYIEKVLEEREQLGSTGIQDGIAIPHGKVVGIGQIVIACGRSIKGVEFNAHDAKPTHLFFVLLAPEFAAGQHLKALARLSRILKNSRFRERLLHAPDEKEMYRVIAEEDAKL